MDENLLFIPHCCVSSKLPKALQEAPHRNLMFYTYGDVSMEQFYRAVAFMVGDPHVMVLSMPTLTKPTVLFLLQCFERGWITDLVLTTEGDKQELIGKYLAPYSNHILYASSGHVACYNTHLVLYSDTQALCLFGPMYNIGIEKTEVAYTAFLYDALSFRNDKDYGNPIRNALLPDALRFRKWARNKDLRSKSESIAKFLNAKFPPYER